MSRAGRLFGLGLAVCSCQDMPDVGEIENYIVNGEWENAKKFVIAQQGLYSKTSKEYKSVASVVRKKVSSLKKELDQLVLYLNPNYGKVAVVPPAFQWAQNSTHVFLLVKFAQRWNAPGAITVSDVQVNTTECCWSFSAEGEHSGIQRRYELDLEMYAGVAAEGHVWNTGSVGKLSATIAKGMPGKWPRLLKAEKGPKNMGLWTELQSQHASELNSFSSKDPKAAQELDELPKDSSWCSTNLYAVSDEVTTLCSHYYPVAKDSKKGITWAVQFIDSSQLVDCPTGFECKKLIQTWNNFAKLQKENDSGVKVGAVDCALKENVDWCADTLQIQSFPVYSRYRKGKKKSYSGTSFEVEDFEEFIQTVKKKKKKAKEVDEVEEEQKEEEKAEEEDSGGWFR